MPSLEQEGTPARLNPELQMRVNFGEAMRRARLAREITKDELAVLLEIDAKTITRLEDGVNEPRLMLAVQIARYFETTIEQMVGQPHIDFEVTRVKELRRAFRLMAKLLQAGTQGIDVANLIPPTIKDETVRAGFETVFSRWYVGEPLDLEMAPEIFDPVTRALVATANNGFRPLHEALNEAAEVLAQG